MTLRLAGQRRIQAVTGHKFFLLFLFLLAYLALYPYMGETGARYQVFRILGAAVTLMSVYAVSFRRGLIVVALILAGPAFVEHAIVFAPGSFLRRPSPSFSALHSTFSLL